MGTADFSAAVFEKLNSVYPIYTAVTSPDKCAGRGNKLQAPPLKAAALEAGVPVLQYDRVSREGLRDIEALAPDIVVTAAFGQILSEDFLAIPKFGVLNVHASLLPKYRGASPIQQAVIDGESETGVTIMRTVKAVDAGDILLQRSVAVGKKETAGELFARLALLGGELIVEAIGLVKSGNAVFIPQDESKATHCKMISKADGNIDFSKSAHELDCFVRGMMPWPSAYTHILGKTLKIFDVEKVAYEDLYCAGQCGIGESDSGAHIYKNLNHKDGVAFSDNTELCGVVVAADFKRGLVVSAGNGEFVRLKEIQLEGAKRMSDAEFLRGRPIAVGTGLSV